MKHYKNTEMKHHKSRSANFSTSFTIMSHDITACEHKLISFALPNQQSVSCDNFLHVFNYFQTTSNEMTKPLPQDCSTCISTSIGHFRFLLVLDISDFLIIQPGNKYMSHLYNNTQQTQHRYISQICNQGHSQKFVLGGIKVFWCIKLLNSRSDVIFTP